MMPRRVLVTGAGGFVGAHLSTALLARGCMVRGVTRRADRPLAIGVEPMVIDDLCVPSQLDRALDGVDGVVHLAARVHVMHDKAEDPMTEFRRANVDVTRAVCAAARRAGVTRLVHLSSIKVYGDGGVVPYREQDTPAPKDPYGRSKLEGEIALAEELGSAVGWTILRPPLIYGAHVVGNFRRLLRLAELARFVPVPLGGITNKRSLLYVRNLVDAIIGGLETEDATGQTFVISDDESLSTSELLRRIAVALGGVAPLLPCPVTLLRSMLRMVGRSAEGDRMFGSLVVDSSAIRQMRGWTPPFSVDGGLRETAEWWKARSV